VVDCFVGTILCLLLMAIFPQLRTVSFTQLRESKVTLTLVMIFHVSSIVLNNLSLVWLGLSINQIIKGLAPLPTMLFSACIVRARYPLPVIISVALLSAGCMVAVPPDELRTSAEGIIACVIAMLALAVKQVYYEMMLADSTVSGLDPFAIVFWQFALGFPFLFIIWLANGNRERESTIDYWKSYPSTAIWISIASPLMATVYNLSTLFLTKVTSALTLNIVSSLKFVLVIILPALIEKDFVPYNWVGVAIYFVFLLAYTWFTVPSETKKYEDHLKNDPDGIERPFLVPGGVFIMKTGAMGSGALVLNATDPRLGYSTMEEELGGPWGHHHAQGSKEPDSRICPLLCCPTPDDPPVKSWQTARP